MTIFVICVGSSLLSKATDVTEKFIETMPTMIQTHLIICKD